MKTRKRMEKFDYDKAMAELEEIVARVEDPSTGLDGIGKLVSRARELTEGCRKYLRQVREEIDRKN